ncbi:MAG TPA: POTRA domain-containing protein [Chitinophagaceae bacterium]|nr:POTRA domain-containing protein [Chitinophagaceae bacterium]
MAVFSPFGYLYLFCLKMMVMPAKKKSILFIVLFIGVIAACQGQSVRQPTVAPDSITSSSSASGRFIVSGIFIKGNKKTKSYIIERELPFKRGDSLLLPELVAKFQRSKELLFNTRLFNDVVVSLKGFRGYLVDIQIEVVERWYLFPVPYFRPIDRNLSAWAEKNYSLSRVNYGAKLLYNNFTGRNDRLRAWLITGYTRQLQLNYDQPVADKSLKHGYGFGLFYSALKEVNSSTSNNEQVFVNTDNLSTTGKYLLKQASASINYVYRPALNTRHLVKFSFVQLTADSALLRINPKYFNDAQLKVRYPELSYTFEYQKVDYVAYVLKGFMGDLNFTRRGLGGQINLSQFTGRFTNGWPLGKQFYLGVQGYGALKLPLDQPFFNQRLFGYGDIYLRGLEKYVVDGVAGAMLRSTLRKQLLAFKIGGGKIPSLQVIPFAVYAKVFGDMGYAYNRLSPENSLANRMLYTAGAGIDVVSVYDFVFRCEYSFNQLGQPGFFFHIRNDF